MSYEIPKNLRYEEKIIFNLSALQSAYLAVPVIFSGIIITKINIGFEFKLLICAIIISAGIGCAFFGLTEHAGNALRFYSAPRESGYSSPEMRNFLEVKKIDAGVIYLNDNSAKSIVEVKPINFHMLSGAHRQATIGAYREFLNSVDFPLQIVMRTADLSIEDYLYHLGKKAGRGFAEGYYSELRSFLRSFITENSVKNRHFYLVIPAENGLDAEKGAKQLEIRSRLCMEKLGACGVKSSRLGTASIVSMLSGFLHNNSKQDSAGSVSSITLLERVQSQEGESD